MAPAKIDGILTEHRREKATDREKVNGSQLIMPETDSQPAEQLSAPKNGADPYRVSKVNILLVDDRHEKLLALKTVLEPLNQNLVTARSGKEALRQLLKQDFAVILLDVAMPGMDGFETAGLIRKRQRCEHTPIIFVTSISNSEKNVFDGYSLGAVDYIITPIV